MFSPTSAMSSNSPLPPGSAAGLTERIVFCIDVHTEMSEPLLAAPTTMPSTTRLAATQRFIKAFIDAKRGLSLSSTNSTPGAGVSSDDSPIPPSPIQHEFAIVLLKNRAEWLMDFSADVHLLQVVLDGLVPLEPFPRFETRSLFETVQTNTARLGVTMPRVICIYGRSTVVPEECIVKIDAHVANPQMAFDFVYLHRRRTEQCDPQIIYDFLTRIESPKAPGYFFEVSKSSRRYLQAIVKLLANPKVRPKQDDCNYRLL
ncbi:hypothetical protein H4R33_005532 [Dimargaris cristalligena]|nr:hypothetical protein H4R33_005532 [Dimargaris cristalligena]